VTSAVRDVNPVKDIQDVVQQEVGSMGLCCYVNLEQNLRGPFECYPWQHDHLHGGQTQNQSAVSNNVPYSLKLFFSVVWGVLKV